MVVYTAFGTALTLKEPALGSGGEGAVYEMPGYNRVAKIYHRADDARRMEPKISAMIRIYQSGLKRRMGKQIHIAWPLAPLYDRQRRFIGFGMEKIPSHTELTDMYAASDAGAVRATTENRLECLISLCDTIAFLHQAGQIFGDFNPNNIKINSDWSVSFVDADSYHITEGGRLYRCVVAASGYVAPEILRRCRGTTYAACPGPTFTEASDCFALAVHVFRMLMNGCHPFACKRVARVSAASGSVPAPPQDARIERGETPFFTAVPGYTVPDYAPSLQGFPSYLTDLFRRAFVAGARDPSLRPREAEWKRALERYRGELRACGRHHQYWRGAAACPYCAAQDKYGRAMAAAIRPPAGMPPVIPRATRQNGLLFWLITLSAALAMELFLGSSLYPQICGRMVGYGTLGSLSVLACMAAGLVGTILYNLRQAPGALTGCYAASEFFWSILAAAVFSAACCAGICLLTVVAQILWGIFLICLVVGGLFVVCSGS